MVHFHTRRGFLVSAGATSIALITPGAAIEQQEEMYTDAEELLPPADIFGPEWVVYEGETDEQGALVEDDEEEDNGSLQETDNEEETVLIDDASRAFESGDEFAQVEVLLVDERTDIESRFQILANEILITGERIDIGDEAIYDELEGFAIVTLRDRNAIALVGAANVVGFSITPSRITALTGADALVDYWHDGTL